MGREAWRHPCENGCSNCLHPRALPAAAPTTPEGPQRPRAEQAPDATGAPMQGIDRTDKGWSQPAPLSRRQRSGARAAASRVGSSSDTVGWMGTVCCICVAVAATLIMSMKP
jgi:hypothetical protein